MASQRVDWSSGRMTPIFVGPAAPGAPLLGPLAGDEDHGRWPRLTAAMMAIAARADRPAATQPVARRPRGELTGGAAAGFDEPPGRRPDTRSAKPSSGSRPPRTSPNCKLLSRKKTSP